MKILLDECIAKRLKIYLPEHEVITVTEKRWNGLKNGQLLEKAVEDNFDLLLTIDKNIMYQQKINNYRIIVAVIDSPSSKIEVIKKFIPRFNEMLPSFEKGNIYIIS
jgi:predicted nuclease of predicted toxin-antitoxin system